MDFYLSLSDKAQEKIDYVFELIRNVNQIPKRFFKHLEGTDGLYEIRIEYDSNAYRIIGFFDDGNLIILVNSFQKKTQKTPIEELKLAKRLKKEYFLEKQNGATNGKKNKIVMWDNHLDEKYGKSGTPSRTDFEMKAHIYIVAEMLKDERARANLTQAQLAERTGTKKSYISRIENGHADIQLSTFYRLIEQGFNKKLEILIR